MTADPTRPHADVTAAVRGVLDADQAWSGNPDESGRLTRAIERLRNAYVAAADPEAECDCESMGGRFGAHRPECPEAASGGVGGGLSEADRVELASQIDGTEDLLDLLRDAADAMHDAVPPGAFVDVRPLQREVLDAWLAARVAAAVEQARAEGAREELREAADEVRRIRATSGTTGPTVDRFEMWLRARAGGGGA